MRILPMRLPPGLYRNGTRYQAKGRWHNGNRVRFYNGAINPIGGWTSRGGSNLTGTDEFVRDGHVWRDNVKNQYTVWGTSETLKWFKEDGSIEDINDGLIAPGSFDPTNPVGYGTDIYGTGIYGISDVDTDITTNNVGRWKFDNWGENLLAMADWDNRLVEWVPGTGNNLAVVANAPIGIEDFIVTDERIVMTIGSAELRKVQWSDQENNTVWTPQPTNQAGSFVLPGQGRMIGIYRLRDQNLIITETDAWVVRYLGPPYVYGFEKVGDDCAPVHRSAAVNLPDGSLMWAGEQNFWRFSGTVDPMDCDLIDFLVADIEVNNISKMFAWVNNDFREVWFHYPSVRDEPTDPDASPPNVECGQYVSWSWETGAWSQGTLPRTAAVKAGVYTNPQMVDWDGEAFFHERQGVNYDDGIRATVQSGPLELAEGERNTAIQYVYTDSQQGNYLQGTVAKGTLEFFFSYRQTPNGTEIESPRYDYAPQRDQPTAVRVLGRDIMLTLEASTGSSINWEWGDFRLGLAKSPTGVR